MMKFRHLLLACIIAGIWIAVPVFIIFIFDELITDLGYALVCLLPIWVVGGGIFSAMLYRRFSKYLTFKAGLLVGAVSGFFGALFSLLPIIILLAYLAYGFGQGTLQGIGDVIIQVVESGGVTLLYLLGMVIALCLVWMVFGLVGGLIGALVFRGKKPQLITSPTKAEG